jgi:hypothetical protein
MMDQSSATISTTHKIHYAPLSYEIERIDDEPPVQVESYISRLDFKHSVHSIQQYVNSHTAQARSDLGLYGYLVLFAVVFGVITLGICLIVCVPVSVIFMNKRRILPRVVSIYNNRHDNWN